MAKADARLWLNVTRDRIVPDGDPEAAFLLASPGKEIPREYAHLLNAKASKGAADKSDKGKAEDKGVEGKDVKLGEPALR